MISYEALPAPCMRAVQTPRRHPGDDAGGRGEEEFVTALIHGAEGLVVHHLRLAGEVGEVGDAAVAAGEDIGVGVAVLRAFGEVVRGPVVVYDLPVFFGHHALD